MYIIKIICISHEEMFSQLYISCFILANIKEEKKSYVGHNSYKTVLSNTLRR